MLTSKYWIEKGEEADASLMLDVLSIHFISSDFYLCDAEAAESKYIHTYSSTKVILRMYIHVLLAQI